MSYTLKHDVSTLEGNAGYTNDKGSHECVVFTQKAASAPNTSTWKKGIKVMDAPRASIPFGTVIATFDENGKYPASRRHAAIYVTHDDKGITVFDQWNLKGKVTKRPIRNIKGTTRSVDDADWYYVVE